MTNTTPVVGEELTADPSDIADADGLTGATFTWRWVRVASDGEEMEVGTGATYVVAAGDVGSRLKVEASFTDDGGAEEMVESAATSAVEAAPRARVSVERVSSPGGGRRGRAVSGDADGSHGGRADGQLQRVGDRRHGGVGRGRCEERRFRGRRHRDDGDGADGGGRRPRGGQHGDGDAVGGCGV